MTRETIKNRLAEISTLKDSILHANVYGIVTAANMTKYEALIKEESTLYDLLIKGI